jgi:restriction endonuclease S subunit
MDPLTAAALALKAFFEYLTEIERGMPPENKEKRWDRYDALAERVFKFLKIKDAA